MPVNLGELLLKEKMITPEQFQTALDRQRPGGGSQWQALVELGFVKDGDIVSLLSRQYGVPPVGLDSVETDPAVINIIPAATARKYLVLPLSRVGKTLRLATADPTNVPAMDEISFMTGLRVEPVLASETALEEVIRRCYGPGPLKAKPADGTREDTGLGVDDLATIGGLSEIDIDALSGAYAGAEDEKEVDLGKMARSADAAPVITLINVMLVDSVRRRVSDIHIEPYEKEIRIRFRADGVLYNALTLPPTLRDPLTSRLKVMAKLDIAEKRLAQYGAIKIKIRIRDWSRDVDFLVSVRPTLWGETIVMRLLDEAQLTLDVTKLGFEPLSLERFKSAISKPYGIVLMTGPARSGKTNTLHAAIAALNKPDVNIMTAQGSFDRFALPGINQAWINSQRGETFATVVRSFAYQDPDIIAIDGLHDGETAQIAVGFALNGRLLLATLDTRDAPSTVSRLVNMDVSPWLVGTAVTLIQAQRLARRICDECRVDVAGEVPASTLRDMGVAPEQIGTFPIYKGGGCQACNGTGYKGRVGLFEGMPMSDGIRELVMTGATSAEIRRKAVEEGMITLRMSGLEKIKQGITTVDEVLRATLH